VRPIKWGSSSPEEDLASYSHHKFTDKNNGCSRLLAPSQTLTLLHVYYVALVSTVRLYVRSDDLNKYRRERSTGSSSNSILCARDGRSGGWMPRQLAVFWAGPASPPCRGEYGAVKPAKALAGQRAESWPVLCCTVLCGSKTTSIRFNPVCLSVSQSVLPAAAQRQLTPSAVADYYSYTAHRTDPQSKRRPPHHTKPRSVQHKRPLYGHTRLCAVAEQLQQRQPP
jgi:hypothetical protein